MRRITLLRSGEDAMVLLTDLLDPEKYPAADLLTLYAERWSIEQLVARVDRPWNAKEARSRLKELLHHVWSDRWLKAKSYRRRPHPVLPRLGVHMSVHRILLEAKQKRTGPRRQ